MSAIDRTTQLFVTSVKDALPDADVQVQRSFTKHGRSNYVYIYQWWRRPLKVRISDHPVGMRRAQYGDEELFLLHLSKPASWSVWLSDLASRANAQNPTAPRTAGPADIP